MTDFMFAVIGFGVCVFIFMALYFIIISLKNKKYRGHELFPYIMESDKETSQNSADKSSVDKADIDDFNFTFEKEKNQVKEEDEQLDFVFEHNQKVIMTCDDKEKKEND